MRVKTLEIKNLRCFEDVNIEFGPGINVLVGKNNSGKSTIIRSLYKLQNGSYIRKEDIRTGQPASKLLVVLEDISPSEFRLFWNRSSPAPKEIYKSIIAFINILANQEERLFFNGESQYSWDSNNKLKVFNSTTGNDEPDVEFNELSDLENENNFIYPYLAIRRTGVYQGASGNEETFRATATLQNLAAKIQRLSNSSAKKRHARFTELCDSILGFRIGVIPGENNTIRIGSYTSDSEVISLGSMGDGVANILGLISVLLTENRKLYLIEELENDIHPQALKLLLDLIIEKSKENQIIISTHSHIVLKYLASVPATRIFKIDWSAYNSNEEFLPTATVTQQDNSPTKRMELLQHLGYDYFDHELYEGYIFLEESSAEEIIRDFLIPEMFPELVGRIKTIAAMGVDDLAPRYINFHRLFVYLHTNEIYYKKAWVIADGDKSGTQVITELQKRFNSWPPGHFINWSKGAFEYYYPKQFQSEVERIFQLKDGNQIRKSKAELLREVVKWAKAKPNLAIKEFSESAKEVIEVLEIIQKAMSKRSDVDANGI